MTITTEQHTIQQVLKGDKAAMQRLYSAHERLWFRLCLRYGRNKVEAEDIFQEGLIMIFKDIKQFDIQKGTFKNWSSRVLVNAALRYLKKHQWHQSFEDIAQEATDMESSFSIEDKISAKELTQIIQQLPSGYRVVFNMYEIEGFAHKEIAALLNISVGTSKSQLSKAKKMLRKQLEVLF